MFCYQRNPNEANESESIPGCESVPYGTTNYCVAREFNPSTIPSSLPSSEPSTAPTLTRTMAPTDTRTCPTWNLLGAPIDTTYAYFAMASDGSVVAVHGGESVYIYRLDDVSMTWKLLADPIDPSFTSTNEEYYEIALSSDGSVVAISDVEYDSRRGRVSIFALHPYEGWTKLGAAIDGRDIGDQSGYSIKLSADGTDIAIGSPYHDNGTGHVRIYTYNIATQRWGQRGDTIRGEAFNTLSGSPIVISRDGSVIAIGARRFNGRSSYIGHVRVFDFDNQDSSWVQRGINIDGIASGDYANQWVDLSSDGSIVVVGAPQNDGNGRASGQVCIFTYEADNGNWIKRGQDINGESANDESGWSVAMSADGTAVAIGGRSAHFRVYDFDSDDQLWVPRPRGKDVEDEAESGWSVAMSADSSVVSTNGYYSTALKIFQWKLCPSPPSLMPTILPDCADGQTPLRLDLITDRFPKQITWQVTNLQNQTIIYGGPYDEIFSTYEEAYCLVKESCYQFTIQDSASDGMCCKWFSGNNGSYKLYFDSIPIMEGGNFTGKESSILLGDTCPSPIPSMMPSSKPSTRPTTSMQPSEIPTILPSNQPSNPPTDSLQPSSVPSNSPTEACPVGSFANITSRVCQLCRPGTYQNVPSYSDSCTPCEVGEYQPDEGGTNCIQCERGTFQPKTGQSQCLQCRAGGYCASEQSGTCDGGFTPCQVGTYNGKIGQDDISACLPCPNGTYADDKEGLIQCPQCPFRLSSLGGKSNCTFCAAQFYLADTLTPRELFQSPDAFCKDCPPDANCVTNTTLKTLQVPVGYWRDSSKTSTLYECPSKIVCKSSNTRQGNNNDYCITNHYGPLCESCQNEDDYFSRVDGRCINCPNMQRQVIVGCLILFISATIITSVYVLVSRSSWKIYINSVSIFISGINLQAKIKIFVSFLQVITAIEPVYGVNIHDKYKKFFSFLATVNLSIFQLFPERCIGKMGTRIVTSSVWPFALIIILYLVLIVHSLIIKSIESKYLCHDRERLHNSEDKEQESPTTANLEINHGTSFMEKSPCKSKNQSTLETSDKGSNFESVLQARNSEQIYDHDHESIETLNKNDEQHADINAEVYQHNEQQPSEIHQSSTQITSQNSRQLWSKLIYISVVVLYLVLPSVSSTIFDAIICRAFDTSDEGNIVRSYLVADMSIECDNDSNEYVSINKIFWVSVTFWPILVPLIFFGLLISIHKSVYSNRINFLAEACRFLWRDYKESMLFWEIIDIYRKLFLTGLINLIDLENGSTKILRLVIAIMVSALYLGILALARPYVQNNDLHLAFTSNVVLICFFSTGIIIHVCQDDDSCQNQIGDSLNLLTATLLAVIMTSVMLVITVVSIGYITINSINVPTIRIVSTGNRPNIEIPNSCHNHAFLSHKWDTGQEKVHTLVRMMQLYLQGVRVWLDVDDLEDIRKLEETVEESAVFILFYTDGYFASVNCRREIYAAVAAKKPIVIIHVNDSTTIDDMKRECHACCTKDPGSDMILENVLANGPILWLGNSTKQFALASIKMIALSLLHHLPYYQKNSEQLVRGLRIGQIPNPVHISSQLVIYTCDANGRAKHIAAEVRDIGKSDIHLKDAKELLANKLPQNAGQKFQCEVLLLYLNKDLFNDSDGEVSELVELSLKKGLKPVLVNEQDAEEGKCEFPLLISQTPDELHTYGLFDELAISLYNIPEYRTVSLYLLLQKMSEICSSAQSRDDSLSV